MAVGSWIGGGHVGGGPDIGGPVMAAGTGPGGHCQEEDWFHVVVAGGGGGGGRPDICSGERSGSMGGEKTRRKKKLAELHRSGANPTVIASGNCN